MTREGVRGKRTGGDRQLREGDREGEEGRRDGRMG